ncbi:hypothetical protein NP493_802g03027 [Ridgeia piscesae]|uniref:glucose-6-phosphate 1-epimerase n=1 Tax=Ridgeia piscesae TaxID=27915 RepID=A0AAD9NN04_RIDPI|nr:hypothetical protein NP493_802g03027 [Ridgeia piscesae]
MSATDVVTLDRGNGTSCRIHRFGATVISWMCKNEEHIFVSSKAIFDNKKAIRGGIPIVFPNFGPWECGPQHGFARIRTWQLSQPPTKDSTGNIMATFTLEDTEDTRKMWNHRFKLTYKMTLLEETLQMEFTIENTGTEEFAFTCLLHTYFRVPDVRTVTISSLKGLTYTDKVKDDAKDVEQRDLVSIQENVDRVYIDTPTEHAIGNTAGGKTLLLQKYNLPDTVVWNPWQEKAAAMADLGDDDYVTMVCVEAGAVATPHTLAPSHSFQARQTFVVSA